MTYIEFKRGEKYAAKGADTSDSMDSFDSCGVLLSKDDVIIDIDELPRDSIDALLEKFNIRTKRVWTDRGVHLYFKKPLEFKKAASKVCQLGFKVEMKTSQNSPNGVTVKRNGVARIVENDNIRETLPEIFNDRKRYDNILGMGEGDGRNNALYAHKQKLRGCQSSDTILRFINEHVFAEQLPPEELESILRSEASKTDTESQLADRIINEYLCTEWMGTIWWYNGTRYVTDTNNKRLIHLVYAQCQDRSTKFVDEIIKQIKYRAPSVNGSKDFCIKLRNGFIDPSGEFVETDCYEDFTPFYIDIEYDQDAKPVAVVDEYLGKLTQGETEYRRLIAQVLGFSLVTSKERIRQLGRFFMFRGDGRNGKGTLLQIIKTILTEENCTALSIKQLCDPRYCVTMVGKLANLGDDIEPEAINNDQMKMLKNISTCDTVSVRHLYSESVNADISTKLYFTTNTSIKSFEKGYAYKRRVMWLPMFTVIDKPDPCFISKLTSVKSLRYWMRIIVDGYRDLLENGWESSPIVNEYNEEYHKMNNTMDRFVDSLDYATELDGKTMEEVKTAFYGWSDEDAKFNSKLFKAALWDRHRAGFAFRKISGSTRRVIMKQEETDQIIDH